MERYVKLLGSWITVNDENYYNYNFISKNPNAIFRAVSILTLNSVVLIVSAKANPLRNICNDEHHIIGVGKGFIINTVINSMLELYYRLNGDNNYKVNTQFLLERSHDNLRLAYDYTAQQLLGQSQLVSDGEDELVNG